MKMSGWLRRISCVALIVCLLAAALPAFAVGQSSTLAKKGDWYVVNCSKLNVRTGPGTEYSVKKLLKRGTWVSYQSKSNGWWKVRYSGGTGYVDKQFLARSPQTSVGTYTTTRKVVIRATPKSSGKRLGTYSKGKSVRILALNGDWGRVAYKGKTGWVALKYLK